MELAIALAVGWLLDLIFGDPERIPHPVVGMGRWIAFWERHLNRRSSERKEEQEKPALSFPSREGGRAELNRRSSERGEAAKDVRPSSPVRDGGRAQCSGDSRRKWKGAVLVVVSLLACFFLTSALLWVVSRSFSFLGRLASLPYVLLSALLVFFCLAGHTLRREVRMVFEALDRSLDEGRRQVARIVGRDTQFLSEQEVRTAALETLAENLSDGVIAPLFWFCVLGVPGMLTYKFVNTFDSMIGYRNARYRDFGRWAARIDDVANYIPARLTACLLLLAGWGGQLFRKWPLRRQPIGQMFSFVRRYGPQHASPNSGWPEAALAGILDCRFGGSHSYFGEEVFKPFIGFSDRPLSSGDMRVSIAVVFASEVTAVALSFLWVWFVPFGWL